MPDGDDQAGAPSKAELHAWAEGQKTIEHQIEKIHEEDDKAIGITRLNILVLGVLASGLSLSIRSNSVSTSEFLNTHVIIGIASLVVSTIVASMAYTSSSYEMGLGASPMTSLSEGTISDSKYFERLGEEYPKWVQKNHKVHRFNSYAITWALIFSISGFTLFIGGIVIGVTSLKNSMYSNVLLAAEILAILILGTLVYSSDYFFETLMKIRDGGL